MSMARLEVSCYICSWIYFGICFWINSVIYSGVYAGNYSGIYPDIWWLLTTAPGTMPLLSLSKPSTCTAVTIFCDLVGMAIKE